MQGLQQQKGTTTETDGHLQAALYSAQSPAIFDDMTAYSSLSGCSATPSQAST
jgi:hypothetical protein